ncbi:hypothetical protein PILCRDRAFT_818523 [Piloderma croceum F 1598]|uniref:Nucleoporin Nup54 alpha-helical domain-containing protein n=1 Tax=Piloderma croceum (strain F 1598) TaxID=765440 RepID=A0A0C3BD03_PILCF|nr:hypothetical protein PILCRDRAFT_818523 [Piloderma croceum F 1598]
MSGFASSSAAFGIKSQAPANTALFGQSNTAKPQGSIFGSAQPTTSGFGNQSQTQQGSSLFGGGAFGQTQNQQPNPPASTGLFGQPAGQQQNQPASTGLFGQPPAGTQQQQPVQNTFGSSFSINQSSQPQGQQGTFGSFGATANQQQPGQSTFGGWGSGTGGTNPLQPQATLPAGSNAFNLGGSTNPGAGSSLFGQPPRQQSIGVSATQTSGPPLFTKSTKFNDLPDQLKKTFEDIESHIQGRVQISNELKQRKLGEEPTKGHELIHGVHKDLVNTSSIIQSDALFTRDIKSKADQAVQDTIVATRIVDGFRNPQQNGAYLKNHATFPLEFFNRVTEQMRERLQWYKNTIEQIERKLSSTASQAQSTPQAISATLHAQHATFISLASKTAALDADLKKIKALYTQLWRSKTGSMRDPFNDLDRNRGDDFRLDSLHVK